MRAACTRAAPLSRAAPLQRPARRDKEDSKARAVGALAAGRDAEAYIQIQRCKEITPRMAGRLIEVLKREAVQFVVAPYEADAQLAWMCTAGKVAAVLSEDSDLLVYGCDRVLFKLDPKGYAEEICIRRLGEATELDFKNFTMTNVRWRAPLGASMSVANRRPAQFRHMCILSGCDYLPSINGMGLKTAYKYIFKYKDINRVRRRRRPPFIPTTAHLIAVPCGPPPSVVGLCCAPRKHGQQDEPHLRG